MAPTTRYARTGDVSIAYQVVGSGPVDLVFAPGFISHWAAPLAVARAVNALRVGQVSDLFAGGRIVRDVSVARTMVPGNVTHAAISAPRCRT